MILQDLCRQRMQTKSNEQSETLNPDAENAKGGARPKTTVSGNPLPGSSSLKGSAKKSHSQSSDSGGSTVSASGRSSTSSW